MSSTLVGSFRLIPNEFESMNLSSHIINQEEWSWNSMKTTMKFTLKRTLSLNAEPLESILKVKIPILSLKRIPFDTVDVHRLSICKVLILKLLRIFSNIMILQLSCLTTELKLKGIKSSILKNLEFQSKLKSFQI